MAARIIFDRKGVSKSHGPKNVVVVASRNTKYDLNVTCNSFASIKWYLGLAVRSLCM